MRAPVVVYGIVNCDSVKQARAWLAERRVDVAFHDFKKLGLPADRLDAWLGLVGWEKLLNRKGTTWRKLDPETREGVLDAASARAVMLAQPSVVKRPVIEWAGGAVTVGFDPATWPPR